MYLIVKYGIFILTGIFHLYIYFSYLFSLSFSFISWLRMFHIEKKQENKESPMILIKFNQRNKLEICTIHVAYIKQRKSFITLHAKRKKKCYYNIHSVLYSECNIINNPHYHNSLSKQTRYSSELHRCMHIQDILIRYQIRSTQVMSSGRMKK